MSIRRATEEDLELLRGLYRSFAAEIPAPGYVEFDIDQELGEIDAYVREHVALVAEANGSPSGFLLARLKKPRLGWISDLYVTPDARRSGVAAALVREAAGLLRERGAEVVELEVQTGNEAARTAYERWGFRETLLTLGAPVSELERLGGPTGVPSRGLVFVQTDDEGQVEGAVRSFLPRLGRSRRTEVHPPANGWIAVDDELCSGDPRQLRRLGQELSYRTGGVVLSLGVEEGVVVRYVLFERGSIADEYASVPEHHGPLPPGDVVALSANPTVAHRLTGADPARLRAVARTAGSATELPDPEQLYREIADVLGVVLP